MQSFYTLSKIVNIETIEGLAEVILTNKKTGEEKAVIIPRNIVTLNKTYIINKNDFVIPIDEFNVRISKIYFHDNSNSFTCAAVTILKAKNVGIIPTTTPKISGYFPTIYENEEIDICGYWDSTSKDKIFRVVSYKKTAKIDTNSIIDFIEACSPGVKRSVIKLLVENLAGDNILETLKNNPSSIPKIKGVGGKSLEKIIEGVRNSFTLELFFAYMIKFDIGSNQILSIYDKYKINSMATIEENPYRCVEDGFISIKQADEIAKYQNKSSKNAMRIRCIINEFLKSESTSNGDLFTYKEKIVDKLNEFIRKNCGFKGASPITTDEINKTLEEMMGEEIFIDFSEPGRQCIYNSYYKYVEDMIVSRLTTLLTTPNPRTYNKKDVDDFLDEFQNKYKIKMAVRQKEAVHMALKYKFSILTGGPGTGKTYTINAIIKAIEKFWPKAQIDLCAPTGKASQRMSEMSGKESFTIHKKLKYVPYKNNQLSPIESDFLIVDEASMIDADLFSKLLINTDDNTSILFVGDYNQLPSIGVGLILRDLLNSEKIPATKLEQIYRQGKTSNINIVSHQIAEGKIFDEKNPIQNTNDFVFIPKKTINDIEKEIFVSFQKFIDMGLSPNSIQVLTPMNNGPLGTIMLNQKLQEFINPPSTKKAEIQVNPHFIIRVGDRVMQTKNNYTLGVFNGAHGYVTNIYTKLGQEFVTVDFDGETVEYTGDFIEELVLAYAMTIHKSQGSEFKAVIMPISDAHAIMLSKNLVYTGITRAKEYIRMIGSIDAFNKAIETIETLSRNSHVISKLKIALESV